MMKANFHPECFYSTNNLNVYELTNTVEKFVFLHYHYGVRKNKKIPFSVHVHVYV